MISAYVFIEVALSAGWLSPSPCGRGQILLSAARKDWGRGSDGIYDLIKNTRQVFHHLDIHKPDHAEVLAAEPSGADFVMAYLFFDANMLPTIHFDYQTCW